MLTAPQHAMLAQFAAGLSTCCVLGGKRGEQQVVNALFARGLLRLEKHGNYHGVVVTDAGRKAAWGRLTRAAAKS